MGPTGERCSVSVSEASVVGGEFSVVDVRVAAAGGEDEGGGEAGCRDDEGRAAQPDPHHEPGGMVVPSTQLMAVSASATVQSVGSGWCNP